MRTGPARVSPPGSAAAPLGASTGTGSATSRGSWRGPAVELGLLATLLGVVCWEWSRLPSWLAALGQFQLLAALAFAAYAAVLLRARRYTALPHAAWIVWVAAAAFRLLLWPVQPSLSDDIYRYLWEGRVLLQGFDPYHQPPLSPLLEPLRDGLFSRINHPELATIYPPLSLAGFAVAAKLWPTVAGMKLWVIAWDLAVVAVLLGWIKRRDGNPFLVAAYAWNPLVLAEYAGSGHNDPCAMLGLVLALSWAERRPGAAALALALGALTKLVPLLALPFLLLRWPWRARLTALGLVVAGLGFYASMTRSADSGLTAYSLTWRNNDLVFAYLLHWLGDPGRARLAAVALVAWFALALGVGRAEPPVASRVLTRVALIVSPTVHPWYLGWALVQEPLRPSWPWLLLSLTVLLSYGLLRAPAEGTRWHLPLEWRWVEYGAPLLLALAIAVGRRLRRPSARAAEAGPEGHASAPA